MSEFTHWNYRMVRTLLDRCEGEDEGFEYAIHEAHYNSDEEVIATTEDPVDVSSYSVDGIRHAMELMALALEKPVIEFDEATRKFREVAP